MTKTITALQEFNAAFEAGTVRSVCAKVYPHIGGSRAVFYKNKDVVGGWLVATEPKTANSSKDSAVRITDAQVEEADSVDYSPYDDAGYAMALIAISDRIRGKVDAGYDEFSED
jgi:hypothetical protein